VGTGWRTVRRPAHLVVTNRPSLAPIEDTPPPRSPMSVRPARLLVAVLLAALALPACKKEAASATGAAGDPAAFANVDCDKMIDHMGDVLLREGTQGQSKAQVDSAHQKMQDQRPTMIAACEKEKPVKKLTQVQYDCLMKASSTAEMSGCQ
jgi:hypothetical protein